MAVLRQCLHGTVILLLFSVSAGADETQAGLPGYCAIGGEAIATRDAVGRMSLLPNYRTLNCTYTNGQTARVAVCDQHRYQQPPEVYPTIWASIRRGWANDIETTQWPRERREKYWRFYEGVTVQSCDE